jgi:hypothetical protein
MRHRAAAFGGAEVRGGGENGPISRRKSPSNGGPECRYDASLAAKHEIQASLIGKYIAGVVDGTDSNYRLGVGGCRDVARGACGCPCAFVRAKVQY